MLSAFILSYICAKRNYYLLVKCKKKGLAFWQKAQKVKKRSVINFGQCQSLVSIQDVLYATDVPESENTKTFLLSPEMYSVSAICIQKCIRNSYLDKIGCAKTKSNIP